MNTRIRMVRDDAGLSQTAFGARMKLSRDTINNLEHDRNKGGVPDYVIKLICSEFNVDEEWLRTGEGEMHTPEPTDKLEEIAVSHGLSPQYAAIFRSLLSLPPEKQDTIVQFVLDTADAMREAENEAEEKKKDG